MRTRKQRVLQVIYSPKCLRDLDDIADWNEQAYDRVHAKEYIAFLRRRIDALSTGHPYGKLIESCEHARYLILRRSSSGHAHLAVYEVVDDSVNILRVFHTSQDWQTNLIDEP